MKSSPQLRLNGFAQSMDNVPHSKTDFQFSNSRKNFQNPQICLKYIQSAAIKKYISTYTVSKKVKGNYVIRIQLLE